MEQSPVVMGWINKGVKRGQAELKEKMVGEVRDMFESLFRERFGAEPLAALQPRLQAADFDTVRRWSQLLRQAPDWPTLQTQIDAEPSAP